MGADERARGLPCRGSVVRGFRRMSTSEAAAVLCLSERQVQRLLKTFRDDGAVSLRHKARGRPSNNRSLEGLRDLTLNRAGFAGGPNS